MTDFSRLTEDERTCLEWVDTRERAGAPLQSRSLSDDGKRAVRALFARGYVDITETMHFVATDKGRAFLKSKL